jgi:FkbM family methyltransferase
MDLLGYYVGRSPRPYTAEWHVREFLERLSIQTVLDVGAHEGEYGQMLRQLGFSGRIISFEPIAASYTALQLASRNDHDWLIHQLALGPTEGTGEMFVTKATDMASLHRPNRLASERFGSAILVERSETVSIETLDRVFPTLAVRPPVLLKLDTQGHDLDVLRGGARVLCEVAALQAELSVAPLYNDVPQLPEALRVIQDMGFHLTGLVPRTRGLDRLRLIELDVFFIRREWDCQPGQRISGA